MDLEVAVPEGADNQRKQPSIVRWLGADSRSAAPAYAQQTVVDEGTEPLPVARYLSREFHEQERDRMWMRVWQMACHETEILEVGDQTTYEICNVSFVIVRVSATQIKAYRNACLHRGMQLVSKAGNASAMTCPFHGWSWNLDGTLRRITESWDFGHVDKAGLCLPEAKVGTWGGFVFINPDLNAEPFEEFIGELPQHFIASPLQERRIVAHVARVMPANWKVSMEAFLESYHVMPTHPQSVPISEYDETQYDIFPPNISRLMTISIAQASSVTKNLSQQDFANYVARATGREPIEVPEGMTFRQALAESRRKEVFAVQKRSVDHLTDVEMLDAVEYYLFPNFLPWHGYGVPIAYRFRPNGDDHDTSLMEVYVFGPRDLSQPEVKAATKELLRLDQPFAEASNIGRLGLIFDQDYKNIVGVQRGLRSTAKDALNLAHYHEARIRHYHSRIDDYLKG